MKRKFTTYLFISAMLAAGTAGGIQVFGQSPRDQSRPQNSGQYNTTSTQDFANLYGRMMNSAQGVPGHGPQNFTIVTKDGTIERINNEPGDRLSKEEFDQVSETRQRIQNAVSQIRSIDVDEAKKKEAKELIAKYLKAEFQSDQESRREQVERLEKQVEQLKKQLTKREESQGKLIELRMQLLENDASGLSFPDSWGNLSGPTPPYYAAYPAGPPISGGMSGIPGGMVQPQYGYYPQFQPQYVNPSYPPNQPQKILPSPTIQPIISR